MFFLIIAVVVIAIIFFSIRRSSNPFGKKTETNDSNSALEDLLAKGYSLEEASQIMESSSYIAGARY